MNSSALKSWLFLFACNLMWALQFTCIKLVQDQVGPWLTVWGPMTLAMVMLYPLVRADRKSSPPPAQGKRPNLIAIYLKLGLLGVVPGQICMTYGTRLTTASNAAVLTLTLPVSTAIFAVIFLGERMTKVRWLSFVLAIGGVLLCSGINPGSLDFGSNQMAGTFLVFLSTLGSSFYNSYGKKALEWHSPMEMLYWTYVVVSLAMLPFVLMEDRASIMRIPQFTMQTWIGMILLTIFHNYLSMVFFLKALKQVDAIQAALSTYLIAFFGVPIAAIWLGERLTWTAVMGGVLVLASTIVITMLEQPKNTESVPAA